MFRQEVVLEKYLNHTKDDSRFSVSCSLIKNPAERADLKMLKVQTCME